jgi:hypothetical protein
MVKKHDDAGKETKYWHIDQEDTREALKEVFEYLGIKTKYEEVY